MEQDHSMETPFQSWLTWPSSLVPFLCWKSRKGMRRRLGGWTDTEETARRERPHFAQRPQASGPRTFHGAGAPTRAGRCGLSLPPTPRRPRRGLPARAEGLATPQRGGLREAAGRREAEAWAPGQRWCPASAPARGKGAAWSSRRALGGAATLSTEPARGRWAGRGRQPHVGDLVCRVTCASAAPGALLGAWPLHPRDRLIRKHVADAATTTALWTARSWGRCSCLGLGSAAAGRGRGR